MTLTDAEFHRARPAGDRMQQPEVPGPGSPVVVYGDPSNWCRATTHQRGWQVAAALGVAAPWGQVLRTLREHRAHLLVVHGPDTLADTAEQVGSRVYDVRIHRARVWYAKQGCLAELPEALTRPATL